MTVSEKVQYHARVRRYHIQKAKSGNSAYHQRKASYHQSRIRNLMAKKPPAGVRSGTRKGGLGSGGGWVPSWIPGVDRHWKMRRAN